MAAAGARVLVVAQAWVGDLVLAQVLFALLARRDPDAAIDVAAPAWAGPLLARMPQVRTHLALESQRGRPGLAARARLARALRGRHARAIVLSRSAKAALLPWLAGIPARTGFAGGGRERLGLINDPRPRPANMSARMAALAPAETAFPELLPRPRLAIDPERAAATARRLGVDPVAPFVALAPGAAGGAGKRWPAARFAQLAARLAVRGYRLCVLGAAADEARGAEIRAAAPARTVDLCGRTTLDEALETLACCRAAVCNDSGLLHLAAAAGTPVAGIYGATSPAVAPPLAEHAAVLAADATCRPCGRETCAYGHYACLRGTAPETVADAAAGLAETAA